MEALLFYLSLYSATSSRAVVLVTVLLAVIAAALVELGWAEAWLNKAPTANATTIIATDPRPNPELDDLFIIDFPILITTYVLLKSSLTNLM